VISQAGYYKQIIRESKGRLKRMKSFVGKVTNEKALAATIKSIEDDIEGWEEHLKLELERVRLARLRGRR
jgi:hypothetical protein